MSLIDRLKDARLIRVLLVYLGASWVVIEAADLLQEALSLPDWVVPVTLILLLAGAVVVTATAFVQASPATDRAEAAGEVPTDWEIDLPDLGRSLRKGRLPHLTWGRALAGGAVVFLALFGLAALLVPSMGGPDLGPGELEAREAAPALAVLPFRVTAGEGELASWREGAVDLLSRNLDGLGGLRAIDARTVLARWEETVGPGGEADLSTALESARRAGARWALVGTAVDVGGRVRVTADVHEVATGARLDGVRVEGSADSLLRLVDALSVDVARVLLEEENPDLTKLRISSITTESPDALSAFLEGEAAYRRMHFTEALESYQRALDLDPDFALAHFRAGSARGWIPLPGALEARQAAYDHRDRLPTREALTIEAEYRARRGALPSGVALLREGVRRYPDDPELWYQLGDIYLHNGPQLRVTPDDAREALERAAELDPGFAPYRIHLVELALTDGDSARAAELLETERRLAGDSRYTRAHQLRHDYLYGGEEDRARVEAELEDLPPAERPQLWAFFTTDGEAMPEALRLGRLACQASLDDRSLGPAGAFLCLWTFMTSGRIQEASDFASRVRRDQPDAAGPAVLAHMVLGQTGLDPDAPAWRQPNMPIPDGDHGLVAGGLMAVGFNAIMDGRDAVVDSVLGLMERQVADMITREDTLDARLVEGLAEGLRGQHAVARGQEDEALDRLTTAERLLAGGSGPEEAFRSLLVWPLAEILSARGREREAIGYLETLWSSLYGPAALARRIALHDRLGETARADSLRRRFLHLWSDGDPHHPLVEEVRAGLPPG